MNTSCIVENFFESSSDAPVCVSIGNFDGVHLGHQTLIKTLLIRAQEKKIDSAVFTFSPHPIEFIQQKKVKLLMPLSMRVACLKRQGVAGVHVINFSQDFASLTFENFLGILIERYQLKHLVIGENTHVGFAQKGTPQKVKAYLEKHGINSDIVALKPLQQKMISSSLIRDCVQAGDMVQAHALLGRPYFIDGEVVKGRGQGKSIGFATANMIPDQTLCLPKPGVYKTQVEFKEKVFSAVSNLGLSPTMLSQGKLTLETHILSYSGASLYGEKVRISFLQRLRAEKKFSSVEALKEQIKLDILKCS